MPDDEPPLGLPKPGTAPTFGPSTSGVDRALARARHRRASRGLAMALAVLVVPVAAIFLLPGDPQDESLRTARTPGAGPTPSDEPVAPPISMAPATPSAAAPTPGATAAPAAVTPTGPADPKQVVGPGVVRTDSSPEPSPDSGGTPDSKTGVDDRAKTLRLFLQAPTGPGGAGDSYTSGAAKYWENRTVKGYRVLAETFGGVQGGTTACDTKAKEGFLITAAPQLAGEQVQSCAGSDGLVRGHTPYLSTGVTENGLSGVKSYFATSLTYRNQAKLVIKMAAAGDYLTTGNGKGWAVVVSNTPNFLDGEQAIVAALKAAGEEVTVLRTPTTGADAGTVANQLREGQFESVYYLGQPLFFVELTGRVGCPAYCPQWAGVGVSMGANSIGAQACNVTGRAYKGEFLSPYPGLDKAAELAPGVSFKDDVEFSTYGSMQVLNQMLNAVPGPSFTREAFTGAASGRIFPGRIFPKLDFSRSRFGGTQAYALRMDCRQGQHVTAGLF